LVDYIAVMHHFFHLIIFHKSTVSYSVVEASKLMEIGRSQVWAEGRVLENLPVQFLNGAGGEVRCMRACFVV